MTRYSALLEQSKAPTVVARAKRRRALTRGIGLPNRSTEQSAVGAEPSRKPDEELVERIRRLVRVIGKLVAYARVTQEEKDGMANIVYAYRRRGLKTTENEITRIAIASLVADYRANGDMSVLARVLAALHA